MSCGSFSRAIQAECASVNVKDPCLQTSQRDLLVQSVLQLSLAARDVGFPSVDSSLNLQQMASSKKHDRAQQVRFLSPLVGSNRLCSLRQASKQVLPRAGENVNGLTARESHICCVHLLQRKLQLQHTSPTHLELHCHSSEERFSFL